MSSSKVSLPITGLSGNEIFCLSKVGFRSGEILVGNSIYSLGLLNSISAGFRGLVGGEITEYTGIISEGRRLALQRLEHELVSHNAQGATGVSSELIFHIGNVEFLSIGSSIHSAQSTGTFTTSEGGQDLYCQIDAHYQPIKFVFGNVAYSIGIGRGILGTLKTLSRGEVKEFSDIFNTTRHRALERIKEEARAVKANSVIGIKTSIIPFGTVGVHEMVMTGTASTNTLLPPSKDVVTSDLTCEEMWSVAHLGMAPVELLLSTSVYSLGIIGGIGSILKSFVRGEIKALTTLIYDAREHALDGLRKQAQDIGADHVVGTQTHIYNLGGGLIEFMALGTAVKRVGSGIKPAQETLPTQAITRDRASFYNGAQHERSVSIN